MTIETYRVKGMSCHGCERSVELAVSKTAGIATVKADAQSGTVQVQFDDAPIDENVIRIAIEKSGYTFVGK